MKSAGGSRVALSVAPCLGSDVHVCHFFRTVEELVEPLLPYFRAGLELGEQCTWVTADPLGVEGARSFLRRVVPDLKAREARGQVELLDHRDLYASKGKTSASGNMLRSWIDRASVARARGFSGCRVAMNTSWVPREQWDDFCAYEGRASGVFQEHGIRAICNYDLGRLSVEDVAQVIDSHEASLFRRNGRWERVAHPSAPASGAHGFARIDISEVARDVAAELVDTFGAAGILLRVRADEPLRGLWDEAALRRITSELLLNAVKHGGGPEVELDVLSAGPRVVLAVRDRGAGIDDIEIGRRGPGLSENGLQVGLWVTRRLVESLGGSLRVASTGRGGATFFVILPHHGR